MGKKKSSKRNNKNGKHKNGTTTKNGKNAALSNFVSEAGPGCFIVRRDDPPDWLIEWEDVDADEFLDDDVGNDHANSNHDEDNNNDNDNDENMGVPDVAIDTDEHTLSVCNVSRRTTKVAYVSVYDAVCFAKDGKTQLTQGSTTDNNGQTSNCITFIVLCPPETFCHLVYLAPSPSSSQQNFDLTSIRIESDVSPWTVHPNPDDEHPFRIGFPLGRKNCDNRTLTHSNVDGKGSSNNDEISIADSNDNDCAVNSAEEGFLCTQGEGGRLTHFFSGNQHAVDFRCPVGTELLAVADGVVVEVCDKNTLTGISVNNLFEWNNILLEIDARPKNGGEEEESLEEEPLFVEYVHISKSIVLKGDVVKKGQVIGYSGSVGFSPEPHLHFSAFRSTDPKAPTCRVRFETTASSKHPTNLVDNLPYVPIAGQFYNAKGLLSTSDDNC